jgi:hypothetical protein
MAAKVVAFCFVAFTSAAIFAVGPTFDEFSLPPGAFDVERTTFLDGHARGIKFRIRAKYPESPALGHYLKVVGEPWSDCGEEDSWKRMQDSTNLGRRITVHQQTHTWKDEDVKGERVLVLTSNYYSSTQTGGFPESEEQHISFEEFVEQDFAEWRHVFGPRCTWAGQRPP